MKKTKYINTEYVETQKRYAALLAKLNPKGSEKELEEIRKRVEARRWGNHSKKDI